MKAVEIKPVPVLAVRLGSRTRLEGSAGLSAAVLRIPPHEEKRRQLMSMLHDTENKTRTEIAEAARSTAELR